MTAEPPSGAPPQGLAPLTTATRQRLQKVFEHAQRCVDKKDHDYANQLFTQCVVEDPSNIIYLQAFLDNLRDKYGDNKKGSRMGSLRIKGQRGSISKAAGKGDWTAAVQAGCAALAINPWDVQTLSAIAQAYDELGILECQLYLLRWALGVDSKDLTVNRQAAHTLERMGQFDQAIACWHRVTQAIPHDEEALKAVSRLSVEKTIHEGGYDPSLLRGEGDGDGSKTSVASYSRHASEEEVQDDSLSPEERFRAKIEQDPSDADNYLQLADVLNHAECHDEAEKVLEQGKSAAGSADLRFVERLEAAQMRKVQEQLTIAQQRHEQDPSDETKAQVLHFRKQTNQVELEIYAAKSDRDPGNARLKYEFGIRLKKAGKIKEAIKTLQAARNDPKRKAQVLLDLGECFQKIEQYKLALSNYELAIDASEAPEEEVHKLALYRAGVLATGLRELDRAEKHLTELAGIDFGFKDVSERLDKVAQLRNSE